MKIQNVKQVREAFSCLDDLIGMERVKNTLMDACIRACASEDLIPGSFVFYGNPGTGKTAVANKLGEILKKAGFLKLGHVIRCTKADLVADYIGQSVMKTRAICEKALDGVLIVNEAYSLVNKEILGNKFHSPFEEEAYFELMCCMERYRNRICFIFEGYPKEMEIFMNANPGMRSRLTNVVEFPDYSVDELMQILTLNAERNGLSYGPGFEDAARKVFEDLKRNGTDYFGNAREAAMLLRRCMECAAERFVQTRNEDLKYTLTLEDIPKDVYPRFSEETFQAAMAALDEMIGLQSVKDALHRHLNSMFLFREYRDGPGRYVFSGNPGTGKSEVARKLGAIFKAMGLLRSGHVVECRRADLISPYIGGTALKTRAKCEESLDGILFVDEAYELVNTEPTGNKFHSASEEDAYTEIMAFMERNRHRVCVIFAGCAYLVEKFLDANDGMRSHVTMVVNFPDYSVDELAEIFAQKAKNEGYVLMPKVLERVKAALAATKESNTPNFANASEANRLLVRCRESVAQRMLEYIKAGNPELVAHKKHFITEQDVPDIPVRQESNGCHSRIAIHNWDELQQRAGDGCESIINQYRLENTANSSWSTDTVLVDKFSDYRAKEAAEIGKAEECGKIPAKLILSLPTSCSDNAVNSWLPLAQATDSAILWLHTDLGNGTAFLISPDGYALTCNHVISGANKIEARVRMPGRAGGPDSWHNCKVINTKEDLDIALIKLDGENFPYLSLAPEGRVIQKGEDFILSGYPLGKRTAKNLTTFHGYVASTEKQTDDNGFIRYNINGEAKSGNSGAPIIALADGRVIGILLGSITERTNEILTEEINYMRPIRYFWEEFVD